jgi:hypothetical protein
VTAPSRGRPAVPASMTVGPWVSRKSLRNSNLHSVYCGEGGQTLLATTHDPYGSSSAVAKANADAIAALPVLIAALKAAQLALDVAPNTRLNHPEYCNSYAVAVAVDAALLSIDGGRRGD